VSDAEEVLERGYAIGKREGGPRSPERIYKVESLSTKWSDEDVVVTATFIYERWCCNGHHELSDAAAAVGNALEIAVRHCEEERRERDNRAYEGEPDA
jgi:hypothetical protein